MPNFQDILNKPSTEVKAPIALPPGSYLCIVDGQPAFNKIGKNQTDCVDFNLKPVQPQPDVDTTALAESLNGAALQDKKIRYRLFLTEDSVFMLKAFLVDGLGIDEGSKTLGEMIPEAMGKQVLATLRHRGSEDGKRIYTEVANVARV